MTTDIDTRAKLSGWLVNYCRARDAEAQAKNEKEALGKSFKEWLDENPGDVLHDGEHGLQALLQERRGTPVYDLITIAEKDPILFDRLLKTGCLQVNAAAVKVQGVQVAGVEKYAGPAPVTTALQVKEIK